MLYLKESTALLYKIFAVFRSTRYEKSWLAVDPEDRRKAPRDSTAKTFGEVINHFDAWGLDALFERLDLCSLLSFTHRELVYEHVPERMERHLGRAYFDSRGGAFFDRTPVSRSAFGSGYDDLVGLYCVLAEDFYSKFLNVEPKFRWGTFTSLGQYLASDFRYRFLSDTDSLFQTDAAASRRSRTLFLHLLDDILKRRSIHNSVFNELSESLERYLKLGPVQPPADSGETGGIKDYWAIWESVCLHWAIKGYSKSAIQTCEHHHLADRCSDSEIAAWEKFQKDCFHRNGIRRRPDLVYKTNESKFYIVDFKYYSKAPANNRPALDADKICSKEALDFNNIEVYSLLLLDYIQRLRDHSTFGVQSELWIPGENDEALQFEASEVPAWNPPLYIRKIPAQQAYVSYANLYTTSSFA